MQNFSSTGLDLAVMPAVMMQNFSVHLAQFYVPLSLKMPVCAWRRGGGGFGLKTGQRNPQTDCGDSVCDANPTRLFQIEISQ